VFLESNVLMLAKTNLSESIVQVSFYYVTVCGMQMGAKRKGKEAKICMTRPHEMTLLTLSV